MEGFITFLLFFALFIWVMKRLSPILLMWIIKRQMKKGGGANFTQFGPGGFGFWSTGFGNQAGAAQGNGQQYGEKKKDEGKVIISDVPKKEKVIDKEIGEYVDFEE